jgi:hypothetical protein
LLDRSQQHRSASVRLGRAAHEHTCHYINGCAAGAIHENSIHHPIGGHTRCRLTRAHGAWGRVSSAVRTGHNGGLLRALQRRRALAQPWFAPCSEVPLHWIRCGTASSHGKHGFPHRAWAAALCTSGGGSAAPRWVGMRMPACCSSADTKGQWMTCRPAMSAFAALRSRVAATDRTLGRR